MFAIPINSNLFNGTTLFTQQLQKPTQIDTPSTEELKSELKNNPILLDRQREFNIERTHNPSVSITGLPLKLSNECNKLHSNLIGPNDAPYLLTGTLQGKNNRIIQTSQDNIGLAILVNNLLGVNDFSSAEYYLQRPLTVEEKFNKSISGPRGGSNIVHPQNLAKIFRADENQRIPPNNNNNDGNKTLNYYYNVDEPVENKSYEYNYDDSDDIENKYNSIEDLEGVGYTNPNWISPEQRLEDEKKIYDALSTEAEKDWPSAVSDASGEGWTNPNWTNPKLLLPPVINNTTPYIRNKNNLENINNNLLNRSASLHFGGTHDPNVNFEDYMKKIYGDRKKPLTKVLRQYAKMKFDKDVKDQSNQQVKHALRKQAAKPITQPILEYGKRMDRAYIKSKPSSIKKPQSRAEVFKKYHDIREEKIIRNNAKKVRFNPVDDIKEIPRRATTFKLGRSQNMVDEDRYNPNIMNDSVRLSTGNINSVNISNEEKRLYGEHVNNVVDPNLRQLDHEQKERDKKEYKSIYPNLFGKGSSLPLTDGTGKSKRRNGRFKGSGIKDNVLEETELGNVLPNYQKNKRGRYYLARKNLKLGIIGIDELKLHDNILSIVRLTTNNKINGYPNRSISEPLKLAILELVQNIWPDLNLLNKDEAEFIKGLVKKSHLNIKQEPAKPKPKSNKAKPTTIPDVQNKLALCLGSLKNGNNSKQLKKETIKILRYLIMNSKMTKERAIQISKTFKL
jgi:hypothetical protein